MEIKVILKSGREIFVPSYSLEYLITEKLIKAFKRSDGWVNIDHDHDKIRDSKLHSTKNHGPERRSTDSLFVKQKS
jgi:hypothetical protein